MKKSEKKQANKYYLPKTRIILIYLALFLVMEIIFYISFQLSSGQFYPFHISFYIYTPILLGLAIMFTVMSLTQTYYVLEKTRFVHVKLGKVYAYNFKDIIYVDEKWSTKHKMIAFITKDSSKIKYLAFDKKHVIYDKILEKSPLMSEEEFKIRHPNIKF